MVTKTISFTFQQEFWSEIIFVNFCNDFPKISTLCPVNPGLIPIGRLNLTSSASSNTILNSSHEKLDEKPNMTVKMTKKDMGVYV